MGNDIEKMTTDSGSQHWWALVDMGSNGIRFSITDLSPPTARLLPLVEQARLPVSLYDSQHSKSATDEDSAASVSLHPIPEDTIARITAAIKQFLSRTARLGVPISQTRILATEATRTAPNSEAFRHAIEQVSEGRVPVTLLPKEEEGRLGALGVASGFPHVHGLVAEVGGGSLQLSWVESGESGPRLGKDGARSLPYGAAALLERLGREGEDKLEAEVVAALERTVEEIGVPKNWNDVRLDPEEESARRKYLSQSNGEGGMTIYLTGGGFRGYGYALMSQQPAYPIPHINGFQVPGHAFEDTETALTFISTGTKEGKPPEDQHYRISSRRIKQLPATGFLIRCLSKALPPFKTVYFAQGGIREGFLYSQILTQIGQQSPIQVAALGQGGCSDNLQRVLSSALPADAPVILKSLAQSLALLFRKQASLPKDVRTIAALRFPITGELAGAQGLTHKERAALGVMLCERWGGKKELGGQDKAFRDELTNIIGEDLAWWCVLLGRIAAMIGEVDIGLGLDDDEDLQLSMAAEWASKGHSKKGSKEALFLTVQFQASDLGFYEGVAKAAKRLKKIGKKPSPAGFDIEIEVRGV